MSDDYLEVSVSQRGAVHVVTVTGDIDAATAPALQLEIDRAIQTGARHIALDLDEVSFIDSAGLRVLISTNRLLEAEAGTFFVVSSSERLRQLLKLTNLEGVVQVFQTVSDGPGAD